MEKQQSLTPAQLFQIGMGFMSSKVLILACQLDLFGFLKDGPKSVDSIKEHFQFHGRGLYDYLDTLVSLGILERSGIKESAEYSNSSIADQCLIKGKVTYLGGFLAMCDTIIYPAWTNLEKALKTGKHCNDMADKK